MAGPKQTWVYRITLILRQEGCYSTEDVQKKTWVLLNYTDIGTGEDFQNNNNKGMRFYELR